MFMKKDPKISMLQRGTKVSIQLLNRYVITCFLITHHLKSNACQTLISSWMICPNSEVSKMVFYAIVARLDPAKSRLIVSAVSLFLLFFRMFFTNLAKLLKL